MIGTLLTFISIFNFCDWVIAFFIAGTAWRIEGRKAEGEQVAKRPLLAVGLAIFFFGFGIVRLAEFSNFIIYRDYFADLLKQIPTAYTATATIVSSLKTLTLLFCWFAVSVENRERRGMLSGNVVRNGMLRALNWLR